MQKKLILTFFAALALSAFTLSAQEYAPAGNRIMTPWASEVSPAHVHPEYPRPQMVRSRWQSLNGLWNYAVSAKEAEKPVIGDGQILVPFAIQSALSGVGKNVSEKDALWYETEFTVPKKWGKDRIILHFEAVDWAAEVWVNGKKAGSHTGGYTPFSFDITSLVKKNGKQVLTLKVTDPTDTDTDGNHTYVPRGKQVSNPHGIWYTAVTGIWQSVWIEPVSAAHVDSYYAVSDIDAKTLSVRVASSGLAAGDEVRVELLEGKAGLDMDKADLSAAGVVASAPVVSGEALLSVASPRLWSPEDPYLYPLRIRVLRKGKAIDEVCGYTSFRKVSLVESAKGFKVLGLNGKPCFNYGPLDQGWWPDGLYTAPTDEALAYDVVKTRDFGFNMIRKHIKVEPARWYYHCDRLGIMVWQDMPCTTDSRHGQWKYRDYLPFQGKDSDISAWTKENYFKEWAEIIDALRVFNCITVWVPFNEAWGQFNTAEAVAFTRAQDPTRLINPASGGNHTENCGDILDCHNYPNPAQYLWSPTVANVVGEYGGIGMPLEGHLWQPDKNWGYIQYKNSKDVTDAYERYALQLKDLVGRGTSGAVYTQTTDVEIEVNGLMTYDRAVIKIEENRVRAINRSIIDALK